MKNLLYMLFIVIGLSVCATVGAMNVPGQTAASLTLKADILKMINMIENAQAPHCSHKVVDTRAGHIVGNSLIEEWVVESCGKQIVYPVTITPDPKGGSYFGVQTPAKR